MTFNSLAFALFFAVVFGGVCVLRRRLVPRNVWLLLASWLFYGLFGWKWLLLLLGTQVFDYTMARLIDRLPPGDVRRKLCVAGSCTANLAVLGFFKYGNFLLDNYAWLGTHIGFNAARPMLEIVQPAGISFYTFQSMSYVIDVYRGRLKAEAHPLHYSLFVSFFPQLVAGPIERATHLLPQVKRPTEIAWSNIASGFWLISAGLFKKVVLADNVATVARAVFDAQTVPRGWETVLAVYAFAIQIYCDFSGYSDIARGCARMMGFDLMRNFDLPYFATNPSDFWRRWHISLSTWLRDYLYIPLGGNRRGRVRTYVNLMLTMLLGGLWHGASWMFVWWGAYHGLLLCGHRVISGDRAKPQAGWRKWISIVLFFQLTCFGWLLFRSISVANFWRMLQPLYDRSAEHPVVLLTPNLLLTLAAVAIVLAGAQLVKYLADDHDVIFRIPWPVRAVIYAAMFLGLIVFGDFGGGQFIYFQF